MQTERTVNGQNMRQVIVKAHPNGNMDKQNQNSIPYRTMDTETNTVRYDTGMLPNQMLQGVTTPHQTLQGRITPNQMLQFVVIVYIWY